MDNLTADVLAAARAGMSYGQWKAKHPNTKPVEEKLIVRDLKPHEYNRVCRVCGKNFVTTNARTLVCSEECKREHKREYNLHYMRQYRGIE